MQVDVTSNASGRPLPAADVSRGDTQRWLAEMEREFTSLNTPHPQDPKAPEQRVVTERPAAAAPMGDRLGSHRQESAAAIVAKANPPATLAAWSVEVAATSSSHDASIGSPDSGGTVARAAFEDVARGIDEGRLASLEPMPELSLAAAFARLAAASKAAIPSPSEGDRSQASGTVANKPGAAPSYARTLMTLSDGDHVAATIRDASLAPAAGEIVARSVAVQLLAAGVAVERIFVNGQRFDTTQDGLAAVPRPPSKDHQDDAA